jgi:hypothetical protein
MARQIAWLRIVAEGAVIVISVLLALTTDAWWNERQERERVRASLSSIAAEIAANRAELVAALSNNEAQRGVLQGVLQRTPAEVAQLPPDSLNAFVVRIRPPMVMDAGGGALDPLLSSGDLGLLTSAELRNALVEWRRVPDEMEENWAEAYQAAQTAQEALNDHGVYASYSGAWRSWDTPFPGSSEIGEALVAFRRDQRAVDAVATMLLHNWWFSSELGQFLPVADSLLSLLAENMP